MLNERVIGTPPLTVDCTVVSDDVSNLNRATWDVSDGPPLSGESISHTFTEPGRYTISVDLTEADWPCDAGTFDPILRREEFVQVCPTAAPEFVVEALRGNQVQFFNESPLSDFGCISAVTWEIFEGSEVADTPIIGPLRAWEPIVALPEPGTYTALLTLGGIGGTAAARATFEVGEPGCGCRTASPASVAGLLVMALLLRRRSAPPAPYRRR